MTQADQGMPPMPGVVGAASVGEKRPGINRMGVGRTVAIQPLRKEMINKTDNKGNVKVVRRIIANVIALDGAPITYGGNLVRQEPDTMAQPVPCVIKELWIDEAALGNQLEPWAGSGNYVVGHLIKLPPQGDNHPAWAITTEPQPEENALFARFWQLAQGRPDMWPNPAPYSLGVAPAAIPQQRTPQQATVASGAGVDVAALIAAAQQASAPAAPAGPPAGSGIAEAAWAALPPEQQQAISAHYATLANAPAGF